MPASSKAANFSAAVPFPPLIIAPACPMRFPGGAVAPATNPTIGLVTLSFAQAAASSSADPPISPIMTMASVCESAWKAARQSMNPVPFTGSPPIPMQVDCPSLILIVCATAS